MKFISSSAPGKAVLSGEYAVLRNAAAISVAVDRRAVVRINPTDEDFHRVITPGHAEGQWRFRSNADGEIDWLDELPGQGLRLVEEAWRACAPRDRKSMFVVVDTVDFIAAETGEKLGFGGSAAAMTALVGALCEMDSRQAEIAALARAAHLSFQDGLGSSVDVATSAHGGVIEYRMDRFDTPVHHPWPDGLEYRFVWSGTPADTRQQIGKAVSSAGQEETWQPLVAAAGDVAAAWRNDKVEEILEAIASYVEVLRRFSIDSDLGVFDAGHDKLEELASSFDVVYKPCGAGGGDIGIVLASSEIAIKRFCEQLRTNDFQTLNVLLDRLGVRTSTGERH